MICVRTRLLVLRIEISIRKNLRALVLAECSVSAIKENEEEGGRNKSQKGLARATLSIPFDGGRLERSEMDVESSATVFLQM